jgi:phage protein U
MAGVTRPDGLGLDPLVGLLSEAGFVAAEEEVRELSARAAGDPGLLEALIRRRLTGEPLAWITGRASFCGVEILVDRGVYVPRWQSEPLARRAVERLPATGTAIDLCTGSGAIAKVLSVERPEARVVATDLDGQAVACATANGVAVFRGDLFDPLPSSLQGCVVPVDNDDNHDKGGADHRHDDHQGGRHHDHGGTRRHHHDHQGGRDHHHDHVGRQELVWQDHYLRCRVLHHGDRRTVWPVTGPRGQARPRPDQLDRRD